MCCAPYNNCGFIKQLTDVVTVDELYLKELTPEICLWLVKLQPLNYVGLPVQYQTWQLANVVFGKWFEPLLRYISSDDFWSGFIDSAHFRPYMIVTAPERYRQKAMQWLETYSQTHATGPKSQENEVQGESNNAAAIYNKPANIRFVVEPGDQLIESAILGDYRCASLIRSPKLQEKHLQLYAAERLNATRRDGQIIGDADLLELFRDELDDEHAVQYSLWKIDQSGDALETGYKAHPLHAQLLKNRKISAEG